MSTSSIKFFLTLQHSRTSPRKLPEAICYLPAKLTGLLTLSSPLTFSYFSNGFLFSYFHTVEYELHEGFPPILTSTLGQCFFKILLPIPSSVSWLPFNSKDSLWLTPRSHGLTSLLPFSLRCLQDISLRCQLKFDM